MGEKTPSKMLLLLVSSMMAVAVLASPASKRHARSAPDAAPQNGGEELGYGNRGYSNDGPGWNEDWMKDLPPEIRQRIENMHKRFPPEVREKDDEEEDWPHNMSRERPQWQQDWIDERPSHFDDDFKEFDEQYPGRTHHRGYDDSRDNDIMQRIRERQEYLRRRAEREWNNPNLEARRSPFNGPNWGDEPGYGNGYGGNHGGGYGSNTEWGNENDGPTGYRDWAHGYDNRQVV
ncbi:hypothetical protein ElyMa_001115700 [Elysia marginata]|uniref:Uncharacterized protein n=1 Tax=Elysia marginata TaxID=1093978 RepID=A0AAV4HV92_9GAST|nr:hypothetical protein ElyMa_001115700 [Elysia marginata]